MLTSLQNTSAAPSVATPGHASTPAPVQSLVCTGSSSAAAGMLPTRAPTPRLAAGWGSAPPLSWGSGGRRGRGNRAGGMGAGEGLSCGANAEQDGCAHVQAGVQRLAQPEGTEWTEQHTGGWCAGGVYAGLDWVCRYRDRCMEGQCGDWAWVYTEGAGVHGQEVQINGGDKSAEHVQVEVGQNGCGSAWGAVWMRSKTGMRGGHEGDLDVGWEGRGNAQEEGTAAVSTQGGTGVQGGHGGKVDVGWDRKGSVESTDSTGGTGKGRCCHGDVVSAEGQRQRGMGVHGAGRVESSSFH
ncbi:hypothetical protein B0H14DRAFT_2591575 [Mycena olivaceomarginata]|nr:hypothetical protein B0H14DRAFT_2591575 [Mycena olivaceomarginata]